MQKKMKFTVNHRDSRLKRPIYLWFTVIHGKTAKSTLGFQSESRWVTMIHGESRWFMMNHGKFQFFFIIFWSFYLEIFLSVLRRTVMGIMISLSFSGYTYVKLQTQTDKVQSKWHGIKFNFNYFSWCGLIAKSFSGRWTPDHWRDLL